MEELKKFTGQAMNLDKNDKSLLPTETREVYNSITDLKGVFTRIEGNTLVNFTLPAGDNKVIGSCNDYSRHAIIYFVKNSLGNHCILRVRRNKIDKVLWCQPVLNFKGRINHANIIGDLLYWTDGHYESSTDYNPPRKINVIRAIGGNYTFLSTFTYEKYDVVYWLGKVYEFIGDNPGVFPLSDTENWQLKGRVYDNLTAERLYWILDRIKYPNLAQTPEVYYSDNVPVTEPPIIIDPPTTIPYGFLYNWDALFELTFYTVKYGLLYNWYAATDARNITSSDEWEFKDTHFVDFVTNYFKAITNTTEFWDELSGDATNEYNFNGKGAGQRSDDGTFTNLNNGLIIHLIPETYLPNTIARINLTQFYSEIQFGTIPVLYKYGFSLRFSRAATESELLLTDGTYTGVYIGNDLKQYRTVKIGSRVYMSQNICETKYRNGDWIPGFDGGVYTPFSNAAWAALTTAGVCAYDDDLNNV